MPTTLEVPAYRPATATPTWVGDAAIAGAVIAASTLGGWVTTESVTTWYPLLNKPEWTPPAWVFGPVWAVLYVMMATAAILVWRARADRHVTSALGLFGLQLSANLLWSVLFFGLRSPLLALADIGVLWLLIGATTAAFSRVRTAAGWLLVPYWLWVSFAAGLNVAIWWMN